MENNSDHQKGWELESWETGEEPPDMFGQGRRADEVFGKLKIQVKHR